MQIQNLHPPSFFEKVFQQAMNNSSKANDIAPSDALSMELFFEKGDKFNTEFNIQGDVFNLDKPVIGSLEIAQNVFVKIQEEGLFFSLDGKSWKDFDELFTGNLNFSLVADSESVKIVGDLFHQIRNNNPTPETLLAS